MKIFIKKYPFSIHVHSFLKPKLHFILTLAMISQASALLAGPLPQFENEEPRRLKISYQAPCSWAVGTSLTTLKPVAQENVSAFLRERIKTSGDLEGFLAKNNRLKITAHVSSKGGRPRYAVSEFVGLLGGGIDDNEHDKALGLALERAAGAAVVATAVYPAMGLTGRVATNTAAELTSINSRVGAVFTFSGTQNLINDIKLNPLISEERKREAVEKLEVVKKEAKERVASNPIDAGCVLL